MTSPVVGTNAALNLTRGNKKIHTSVAVWSLPAPLSCPGAGVCLLDCYYFKVQKGLNGVVSAADAGNFEASRRPDFVERTVETLQGLRRRGVVAVRVHDGGDFYSNEYVRKWAEIARRLPQLKFWAYSKSLNLDLAPLEALPNFRLIKSFGGLHDSKIDKTKDNYARVIEDESQATENEFLSQTTEREFLCPADKPGVKLTGRKQDTWCGNQCSYCLPHSGKNGHRIRVAFVEKNMGWNGTPDDAAERILAFDKRGLLKPSTLAQETRLEDFRRHKRASIEEAPNR